MPINSFLYPGVKVTPVFEVANSIRYDDGAGDSLTRSQSTPSSQRIFTFSAWVKRAYLNLDPSDPNKQFFSQHNNTTDRMDFRFQSGGTIDFFHNSPRIRITTNRLFRDVSAWYHIVLRIDTTQATAADRARLYVNGVQETSFSTADYGSQNADLGTNYSTFAVGDDSFGTGHFDGYFAEVVYCDGQSLDPTSFGEFDSDTGIWKPIDVSGLTFGNNGFYLDFQNSGSLGADVSGNGNNFTVNNLTSIDQTTDTPTNNFCTLNPLDKAIVGTQPTFSEGNLQWLASSNSTSNCSVRSTMGVSSGKWYFEAKFIESSATTLGYHLDGNNPLYDSTGYIGSNAGFYGIFITGGDDNSDKIVAGTYTDTDFGAINNNDIVGVAFDLDNGKFYFSKNGTWLNSGDPTSGATGTGSFGDLASGTYIPTVCTNSFNTASNTSFNFGSPAYSISSGNSDANGYGNMEFAVPSGYYVLNSKNLAEFG